jgi:hypothetical protein
VLRVLLYRSDWGPITETIDGKTEKKNKWVSRLFEFAIVTDKPLPAPRTEIRITGRFFKYRAIPVTPNVLRDRANDVSQRQSDNVYTCLAVAADYTQVPPPPLFEASPLGIALGVGALLMGFAFWRMSRRDAAGSDKLQEQIKKLRETRRALEAKAAVAPPAATAGPAAAVPAAESGAAAMPVNAVPTAQPETGSTAPQADAAPPAGSLPATPDPRSPTPPSPSPDAAPSSPTPDAPPPPSA